MTWHLRFDYPRPPLTSNQRMHWRQKAALTKQVRAATALAAKEIPPVQRVGVSLTWFVATRHRRDVDNLVPTLKAMCDGLVDAGVVADDTFKEMDKHMPVIVYLGPGHDPYMQLSLEALA